jgi:CRP-like cAMP-binding protein
MKFRLLPNSKNRLLASLPEQVYKQLRPSLEQVSQSFKQTLQEPDVIMSYVYFPLTTVVSILVPMDDGSQIEVATVGNEGMVGLPVFLGSDTMQTISIVQISGEALRIPADTFKEAFGTMEPFRNVLQLYTQALFMLTAQTAACNRVHDIAQRCARWLLITHDRVETDRFPLTQEFLADMLGVRRAGVSEVASALQREGLIQYSRGVITVLDRSGLEARSCECYQIIRQEFERSFG